MPLCYDCLSEDVTVKVTGQFGFDHWFCAADWAAEEACSEWVANLLAEAVAALNHA